MNLGRGTTLPAPASVDHDRFIVEASASSPAQWYKKVGTWPAVSWVNMTPQQTSIEFVTYAAENLVAAFESQL